MYTLRHSHASQALLNGMHLKMLSENLGTSVRMSEAHYAKFSQAGRQKLVEEFGPSFAGSR